MPKQNAQSDIVWYLNLKLLLLFQKKITGSLSVPYRQMHRDMLIVYLSSILDDNEGKEGSIYEIFKKKLPHRKRHIVTEKTGMLLLSYIVNASVKFKFHDLCSMYDIYLEEESKNINPLLFNYAVLNRLLEDIRDINSFESFRSLQREVNSFLKELSLDFDEVKDEIATMEDKTITFGISIDAQVRLDYLKMRLAAALKSINDIYWDFLIQSPISEKVIEKLRKGTKD